MFYIPNLEKGKSSWKESKTFQVLEFAIDGYYLLFRVLFINFLISIIFEIELFMKKSNTDFINQKFNL